MRCHFFGCLVVFKRVNLVRYAQHEDNSSVRGPRAAAQPGLQRNSDEDRSLGQSRHARQRERPTTFNVDADDIDGNQHYPCWYASSARCPGRKDLVLGVLPRPTLLE